MSHERVNQKPIEMMSDEELLERARVELGADYLHTAPALNQIRIFEFMPELGTFGIRAEMGQGYPFPSFENIWQVVEGHWADLQVKWRQGFSKLQLTPIAMPLPRLSITTENYLWRHWHRKYAGEGQSLAAFQREIGVELMHPRVSQWTRNEAEANRLVYYPNNYHMFEHDGVTKSELTAQLNETSFPGWNVILIEDIPILSEVRPYEIQGGRVRLENDLSPVEYLARLEAAPSSIKEYGFTIEDFITHFLIHLYVTGEPASTRASKNGTWCLANFYADYQGGVPRGEYWGGGMLTVDLKQMSRGNENFGCRAVVRLNDLR